MWQAGLTHVTSGDRGLGILSPRTPSLRAFKAALTTDSLPLAR